MHHSTSPARGPERPAPRAGRLGFLCAQPGSRPGALDGPPDRVHFERIVTSQRVFLMPPSP